MRPGVMPAVDAHYQRMRRLSASAILAARRSWQRIPPDRILAEWEAAAGRLLVAVTSLQVAAAESGASYGEETLAAQRLTADAEGAVNPETFAGWASDGRTLESLLLAPLAVVATTLDQAAPPQVAYDRGRESLERIVHTQIGDAGRAAASVDIASRPGAGWTRMLNPPSCSRCVVLAGRFYQWNAGFDRHPRDDCVHVATTRAAALREGLVDDPRAYFDSLTVREQDKAFTVAGAKAIRDGADIGQVVNARRGMATAGRDEFGARVGRLARSRMFGQDIFTTLEGTTTRGVAGRRLIAEGARLSGETAETVRRRARGGDVQRTVTRQRVQIPRLMPESIYELATDRADAIRLLRRFGYLT